MDKWEWDVLIHTIIHTMSDGIEPYDMQDEFLYDVRWTKPIDNMFIEIICSQHDIGHFSVGRKNIAAINAAIDSISRRFDIQFTYHECQAKLSTLFRRYSTFSWMLSHPENGSCLWRYFAPYFVINSVDA